MNSEQELAFTSIVTDLTFLASSTDWDSEVATLFTQLFYANIPETSGWGRILDLSDQIHSRKPKMEFLSLTRKITNLHSSRVWKVVLSLISQIMFLVNSMDLDSEAELVSLIIKKIISLFKSKPDSELELVSLIIQTSRLVISMKQTEESEFLSLIRQLVSLESESALISLLKKTISRFRSMNWEPMQFICLSPEAVVKLEQGKFHVTRKNLHRLKKDKEKCRTCKTIFLRSTRKIHFHCQDCNGEDHEQEYKKAPVRVRHPLHPKHSLQLVLWEEQLDLWPWQKSENWRECNCCDEDLKEVFYYCSACDYAMNLACADKPPFLSIDHPKWHEHTLVLFPRQALLTCNVCALDKACSPIYMCPPCDFVVHKSCLSLPRVIRISRHPHRISFSSSFNEGDWFCGVCRKKMDNDYGGYSCIKDGCSQGRSYSLESFATGCSYGAHSRCATQSNVWDGIELEGVPEENEEELESFVRISDGIIQHFSHQHHHLRLDENMGRDYDENKECHACITPIYFGNFYSCMQCEFILHEKCANLSRRIHHPIHPHMLTLGIYESLMDSIKDTCSACNRMCTCGFVYECGKEECGHFKLNVQCATMFEPLVYEGHKHHLFLTSKPRDQRKCSVCKSYSKVTFNCIECNCNFSVCFACATIPQRVRYKHDKHTLTLSYAKERSTMEYWCEACETKIKPEGGFYKCDEYCCVTIHIECLIGKDFYMNPSSCVYLDGKLDVLPNNQHMSRPFCSNCKKRCSQKVVFRRSELIFCSTDCNVGATANKLQQELMELQFAEEYM